MKKHKVFELTIDVIFACVLLGLAINLISSEIASDLKSAFISIFPNLANSYNYVLIAFAIVVILVYIYFKKKVIRKNEMEESDSSYRKTDSSELFISTIKKGKISQESLEVILQNLDKSSLSKSLMILRQKVPAKNLVKVAAKFHDIAIAKKNNKDFQGFRENIQLAAKLNPEKPIYATEAGRANAILDDPESATEYYLAAEIQYRRKKDFTNLRTVHNNLGMCNHQLGKYEEAIKHYKMAYEVASKHRLLDTDEEAIFHINVGGSQLQLQNYNEALMQFTMARNSWNKDGRLGPREDSHIHRLLGEVLNAKGEKINDKNCHKEALSTLHKALEIDIANFGYDDELCGWDLIRIAQALEGLNELDEAEKAYQDAFKILEHKFKNPNHFEIKKITEGLERIKKKRNC